MCLPPPYPASQRCAGFAPRSAALGTDMSAQDTPTAVAEVCRWIHAGDARVTYAGIKDRRGVTTQYFTAYRVRYRVPVFRCCCRRRLCPPWLASCGWSPAPPPLPSPGCPPAPPPTFAAASPVAVFACLVFTLQSRLLRARVLAVACPGASGAPCRGQRAQQQRSRGQRDVCGHAPAAGVPVWQRVSREHSPVSRAAAWNPLR